MYQRDIDTNIDIRNRLKAMLNNSKSVNSKRISIPIKIIYDALYLDKWQFSMFNGNKCHHGDLRPTIWDIYFRDTESSYNNSNQQQNKKNLIQIRQSFSKNFEFSLVNSCLLEKNKKSNFL